MILVELLVSQQSLMKKWRVVRIERGALPLKEIENVRRASKAILSREKSLTIDKILKLIKMKGFEVFTNRHLAVILAKDPKNRFKSENGIWTLRKTVE